MLAPILFYTDAWGDHVAVSLTRDSLGRWVVTARFGDTSAYRRFWRWRPATYAYDEAVDNAELLVAALRNGIPGLRQWPEDWSAHGRSDDGGRGRRP